MTDLRTLETELIAAIAERSGKVDDTFQRNGKENSHRLSSRDAQKRLSVRYGSLADNSAGSRDVRFNPESGHAQSR